jgi:hypothetical protein
LQKSENVRLWVRQIPKKMQKSRYFRALVLGFFLTATQFSAEVFGQTFRLSTSFDRSTRAPIVRVDGTAGASGTLEVSSAVRGGTWSPLVNFTLSGSSYVYIDSAGVGKSRFYRVRSGGTTPVPPVAPPAPLSDLANLPNAVFTPGEGFDTVQYAANGSLAYIFWRNRDLVLRERRSGQ